MIKTLFILLISLSLIKTQTFYLFHQELTDTTFTQSSISGWTNNKGFTDYITQCDNKSLLGGYDKFGQRTQARKTFQNFPTHNHLKIQFTLYKVDSWDSYDFLRIYSGSQQLLQVSKVDGNEFFCGNLQHPDTTEEISLQFAHTASQFELVIEDFMTQLPNDESWGIRDLKLYLDVCPNPITQQPIGDQCFTKQHLTTCSDSLKSIKNNIKSDCTQQTLDDGEFYYDFIVSYQEPYTHNPGCFTQQLFVEETQIFEGNSAFDEWKFDADLQQISFSVKQSDLESVYNCSIQETNEEFQWNCDFQLRILLGGAVQQHVFNFEMKVVLDKEQKAVIDLKVIADNSQGECCENELDIATKLKFCTNSACTSYHDLPYTANRSEELFIEHSITSPDFLSYYLHPSEVSIFGVLVDIIEVDGSSPGKLIYTVKSELAFDDMLVEVISILSGTAYSARRFLQELGSSIRDDYDIKAISQISVVSDPQQQVENLSENQQELQEEEQNDSSQKIENLTYGLIAAGVFIGIIVLSGLFFCYKKLNNKQKQQRYEEKEKVVEQ